jgi:hypothetical protein
MICPTCGEDARDATWRELRRVPGALPAFRLSHRRAGGERCETVRGPWAGEQNICTDRDAGATIGADSRSVRADERATA